MVNQSVRIINGKLQGTIGRYIEDFYRNGKRICVVEMDYQYLVEFDYNDVEFIEG